MKDVSGKLDSLQSWLGKEVGEAFVAAMEIGVPCGSSARWQGILQGAGVSPSPADQNERAAKSSGQLRGAPPDEFYEVLGKIVSRAEERIRLISPEEASQERRWERLRGVIGRLREETIAAYRKRVMPKRQGGMFGAAMAAAKAKAGTPVAAARQGEAFVMRCDTCGAPRLKDDVFVCEYCDTPYAGKPEA